MWEKFKLLILSILTFFHTVFYTICIWKSFNSHISVVVCSFFEFEIVSKWSIREWVNLDGTIGVTGLNGSYKLKNFNVVKLIFFYCKKELQTFFEKQKMLVTGVFSFSNNVFKRLLPQGCWKMDLCVKRLRAMWYFTLLTLTSNLDLIWILFVCSLYSANRLVSAMLL